ncbi:S-adenosyl-L-methionine-dependent methyltransferase [Aspergillus heteromorphus CBS 117.55]|uniref:catechol O-methyltransferase n=1 Tax=Aspergillus heteromorphus CBS 117.55 TaxID=1448321 RepID=A0A317WM60_9EURO|nr:S-adenosyl-L-methionine-dependent methyltransferase [Aspergillus heteromorphus CBS 117.55]PWY87554.1 S-adenosyl-L-methionine-dependent methyltransferase [Aspergillus heteromorphus CBS 117.55]
MEAIYDKYPSLRKFEDDSYKESHDGREIALLKYIYDHPSLPQARNSPSTVLSLMDEFAAKQDFLINIGADKAGKLQKLIGEEKPTVVVELGGYVGYSAILFADALRQATPETTDLRVWSLEADPLMASIAMNFVELAGLSEIVKVVVGPAADSLTRLNAEGKLSDVDFLFLDHVEELYLDDLQVAEELGLLHPRALVVADNVVRPGAPAYREYVRGSSKYESWGLKALIVPGDCEDELEISRVN